MHEKTINQYEHSHDFCDVNRSNERRTLYVIILSVITMIIEITYGEITGSMALLAEGWHMGTHVLVLGISYTAYILSRRLANSSIFTFGTGKFGVLGGYTSALFLGIAAVWLIFESVSRLINPEEIEFNEAIAVAVLGFAVSVTGIFILGGTEHIHFPGHTHGRIHDHGHERHRDHNLLAVYLHVISDAITSILAIIALLCGKYFGLNFLDPVIGIFAGIVITRWALGLIRDSSGILLDRTVSEKIVKNIREAIQSDTDSRLVDVHVWRIGSNNMAGAVTIVTGHNRNPEEYRQRLGKIPELKHVTIEVVQCNDPECACEGNNRLVGDEIDRDTVAGK